jgi:hypothetical protein
MIVVYTSYLNGNNERYAELFELAEERRAQSLVLEVVRLN